MLRRTSRPGRSRSGVAAVCVIVALGLAACTSSSTAPDDPVASTPEPETPDIGGPGGGGPGQLPEPGEPEVVVADPNAQQPRQISAESVSTAVEGGKAVARPVWWSGVAPCAVLQRIDVERSGAEIVLTIYEGGDPDAVCIAIAVLKAADVDLGKLESGTYTVRVANADKSQPDPTAQLVV